MRLNPSLGRAALHGQSSRWALPAGSATRKGAGGMPACSLIIPSWQRCPAALRHGVHISLKPPPRFTPTFFKDHTFADSCSLSLPQPPASPSGDAAPLVQTRLSLALLPLGAPHTLHPPPGSFPHPFTARFHSYTHVDLLACGLPHLFEN